MERIGERGEKLGKKKEAVGVSFLQQTSWWRWSDLKTQKFQGSLSSIFLWVCCCCCSFFFFFFPFSSLPWNTLLLICPSAGRFYFWKWLGLTVRQKPGLKNRVLSEETCRSTATSEVVALIITSLIRSKKNKRKAFPEHKQQQATGCSIVACRLYA